MKLHRFFLSSNINKGIINTSSNDSLAHQLRSVFRFHEGDKAIFFDGSGIDYVSEIVSLSKGEVSFRVIEERPVKPFSPLSLSIAFSLIKKDNAEWVIEKCTELGVARFIPILSERSEKKGFNMDRARKILIEACEQSGRADVPELAEPQSLEAFLVSAEGPITVFHTEGSDFDRSKLPRGGSATVCIGPEGGWSPRDLQLFEDRKVGIVKVHAPILRAETASIAIASVLLIDGR